MEVITHSFDVLAALGQPDHALVRDLDAARNVQALQPPTVLGDSKDGSLGDLVVAGHVESQEMAAILDESNQAGVGQPLAVGQGQALYAVTHGQGRDAAIADLVGYRC